MLIEKIKQIYPSLSEMDFLPATGFILIQDDVDGKGEYIARWEHPTIPIPSKDELN